VTATFSEAVAAASVSPLTYSLSAGALPVNGLLTVSGPVVTFTPSPPLAPGTQFTARLAVGITDLAGNALAAPFTWIFTTEAAPWPGTRQLGTPTPDSGNSVATDRAGNVYVAGITSEDLDGAGGDPLFGGVDLFLAKFGPAGNLLFTRQLGTVSTDEATGVAVDGVGNVYVAGSTSGDLDGVGGDPLFGGVDLFLAKFNPAGNLLFTRQLGTVSTDEATGVAVDGVGNVYVAGSTNGDLDGAGGDPVLGGTDFFLAKFDASGNLLFTRQLGTTATDDDARGVAVDGTGNVYVTGSTQGDLDGTGVGDPLLGGTDFFLAKFDPDGSFLGTRQLGTTATDDANGVSVDDAGNVYVAGSTNGDLDGSGGDPLSGGVDLFLVKFDPAGNLLFTRQLGTVPADEAFGVAAAGLSVGGNVFVTGETLGGLDGNPSAGDFDLFLAKFDPFGVLQ
jgi:uncharacterized protein (AIM24 family)